MKKVLSTLLLISMIGASAAYGACKSCKSCGLRRKAQPTRIVRKAHAFRLAALGCRGGSCSRRNSGARNNNRQPRKTTQNRSGGCRGGSCRRCR